MSTGMPSTGGSVLLGESTSSSASSVRLASATSTRLSLQTADNVAAANSPTIVYYGARMVRCRIDRGVPIEEIIKQLCAAPQLAVNEPPSLFAMRDATNSELITIENIDRKLDSKVAFNLVASPIIEAAEIVDKLVGGDQQTIKATTFALKSRVKEDPFLAEFTKRGGVSALASVIQESTGNTLAYALSAMQSILELDYGYKNLDVTFVKKIVSIIVSQALVNIVRPALAILRRLVSTHSANFGFNIVWPCLVEEESFFTTLVTRITREGDKLLTGGALSLLNAVAKSIPRNRLLDVLEKLEDYSFRKAVISLIETRAEGLTPQILQFQQIYANAWYELQLQAVSMENPEHLALLKHIYEQTLLDLEHADSEGYDYRKLGFVQNPPDIVNEFLNAGVLGLHTLSQIATRNRAAFASMVLEQVNRPDNRRCPIALVSLQVTRILSEQFDLSGSLASTSFQPFLLDFYRIHFIVMEFFVRMYAESGATLADFARVSTLTTSQVRLILGTSALNYHISQQDETPKSFFALKQDFEQTKYEEVRDRQMKELEVEDDLMSKLPIRSLRDKLYRESLDFIRAQRIRCLQMGAWFSVPQAITTGTSQRTHAVHRYRFYRLAPNRRFLHFVGANERRTIRPGLDDLPETAVTDVVAASGAQSLLEQRRSPSGTTSPQSTPALNGARSPGIALAGQQAAALRLALVSQDTIVAELCALDQTVYAEWIDGLNLLLPGGFIATKEAAELVQTLTDVSVKIRLLDLTGERLEIPAVIPTPIVPPAIVPFYYSE